MLNKKERVKINNNLKLQREKIGLTQLEVAQKAKITERSYQYYEAGERLPNIRTALKIAIILNTNCEKLFNE
ncbi:helix-turn-helix transcriptional regulator [Clostridioides difficile]|uniref:XRE family transcriptional regulator n=3 Tax=Clostridioides difficile TaxID=1496 RepID=A0A069A5I5_CLODI|nr:helix-turn-helix transcriptional regulator [Clostridioides difficile]EQE34968.1 helix-turn-helix family protein [Clostridioides difficile CD34]EQE96910.1 helix-turn-helix family protein [Clostridioides difficile CD109]EQG00305.1 helix-turn-helix family protein [Clostridioides difficile 840]EQG97829.1 helix-turn-helix family protein [Clostridioides difficile DA00189]EQH53324.1 helix-turn-helix family protein [Clostridioides difficile DA00245]EQK40446.1 helix-turn-helix family protein [Clost